jgi:predicted Zn-dependent protease
LRAYTQTPIFHHGIHFCRNLLAITRTMTALFSHSSQWHIARARSGGKRFLCFLAAFLLSCQASLAQAAGLIQDAELEDTLHRFTQPILEQAGLNPRAVQIFMINDPSINAFVAGGSNIFINTGLMMATRDAGELIGVLAHETGHIAGGHLIRGKQEMSNANMGLLISTALAAAAAIAGGADAAMGAMTAGQQATMRGFLAFTRTQESAADQAALRYLDGAGITTQGMLTMFETLRQKENRQFGTTDPYARTHPMTQDRITHIRSHVMQSDIAKTAIPADFPLRHARLVAKLRGFIDNAEYTLANYPSKDQSLPAHMARAVAYFRQSQPDKALAEMDAADKLSPNDPYLLDLRGQILLESGRVPDAIRAYARAIELNPDQSILQSDFARALLATNLPSNLPAATAALERATSQNPNNTQAWDMLATAYGRQNDETRAALAQAEAAVLRNQPERALLLLRKAQPKLQSNTPSALRAEDLRSFAEEQNKAKKEAGGS